MSVISVKGKMITDQWGPFSFSVIGKNSKERQAIADFIKPYYRYREREHPAYRCLEHVDFFACLYLTLNGKKAEVQIGIMPPHTLLEGTYFQPQNQKKISVKGEFYCQYCGPLSLTLFGSNDVEQKKIADWIRSYLKPNYQPKYLAIQDLFGRGCLTIWFSNKEQTEADIKITVFPSLQFIKSIKEV